jgi:hypothetical protein
MSEDLATVAHYVGVQKGDDLQVFAVGSAPADCEKVLKDYPALIVDPTFKIGAPLSPEEIKARGLRADDFQRVL